MDERERAKGLISRLPCPLFPSPLLVSQGFSAQQNAQSMNPQMMHAGSNLQNFHQQQSQQQQQSPTSSWSQHPNPSLQQPSFSMNQQYTNPSQQHQNVMPFNMSHLQQQQQQQQQPPRSASALSHQPSPGIAPSQLQMFAPSPAASSSSQFNSLNQQIDLSRSANRRVARTVSGSGPQPPLSAGSPALSNHSMQSPAPSSQPASTLDILMQHQRQFSHQQQQQQQHQHQQQQQGMGGGAGTQTKGGGNASGFNPSSGGIPGGGISHQEALVRMMATNGAHSGGAGGPPGNQGGAPNASSQTQVRFLTLCIACLIARNERSDASNHASWHTYSINSSNSSAYSSNSSRVGRARIQSSLNLIWLLANHSNSKFARTSRSDLDRIFLSIPPSNSSPSFR